MITKSLAGGPGSRAAAAAAAVTGHVLILHCRLGRALGWPRASAEGCGDGDDATQRAANGSVTARFRGGGHKQGGRDARGRERDGLLAAIRGGREASGTEEKKVVRRDTNGSEMSGTTDCRH